MKGDQKLNSKKHKPFHYSVEFNTMDLISLWKYLTIELLRYLVHISVMEVIKELMMKSYRFFYFKLL